MPKALLAALIPTAFSLKAFMALSESSCYHQPLSSFFRLYVVDISLERKPSLNLPFNVFFQLRSLSLLKYSKHVFKTWKLRH
jgi:hypothetical protein